MSIISKVVLMFECVIWEVSFKTEAKLNRQTRKWSYQFQNWLKLESSKQILHLLLSHCFFVIWMLSDALLYILVLECTVNKYRRIMGILKVNPIHIYLQCGSWNSNLKLSVLLNAEIFGPSWSFLQFSIRCQLPKFYFKCSAFVFVLKMSCS